MRFLELDVGRRLQPYEETWAVQRTIHAQVAADVCGPTVLFCEHEDVYTAGRRTASWDRPVDGTPVVDVDRGGRITWHGPGQLVAYPIVRLREPIDVVAYVRALEEAVIGVCGDLGLTAVRVEGRSGVWFRGLDGARDRKVAAIGVRVARGVTMHGVALNCSPDLAAFTRIVPCGIPDADVTSLSVETGRPVAVLEVLPALRRHLDHALEPLLARPAEVSSGDAVAG